MRRVLAVLGVLAAVAGCGDEPVAASPPTRSPEPIAEQPEATLAPEGSAANAYIGSIAVDPADRTLFLGTGLGLYRYEGRGEAERVVGELRTPEGSGRSPATSSCASPAPGSCWPPAIPRSPASCPRTSA